MHAVTAHRLILPPGQDEGARPQQADWRPSRSSSSNNLSLSV